MVKVWSCNVDTFSLLLFLSPQLPFLGASLQHLRGENGFHHPGVIEATRRQETAGGSGQATAAETTAAHQGESAVLVAE